MSTAPRNGQYYILTKGQQLSTGLRLFADRDGGHGKTTPPAILSQKSLAGIKVKSVSLCRYFVVYKNLIDAFAKKGALCHSMLVFILAINSFKLFLFQDSTAFFS